MNEKLIKLAEQAHLAWCIQTDYDRENMQRFVSIIVGECAVAYHKTRLSDTSIETHFRRHLGM